MIRLFQSVTFFEVSLAVDMPRLELFSSFSEIQYRIQKTEQYLYRPEYPKRSFLKYVFARFICLQPSRTCDLEKTLNTVLLYGASNIFWAGNI